jgi:hypothetical protein
LGDWHYFLAHDITAIGRVNIETGKTEYLRVPVQLVAGPEPKRIWDIKEALPNDTKNSRGIDIATDKRAKGTGWGHVSAASPILVNRHLFFPIMNGTVYVIDAFAETLDEKALIAVNDLGSAGKTWTLASFSYANGKLLDAHDERGHLHRLPMNLYSLTSTIMSAINSFTTMLFLGADALPHIAVPAAETYQPGEPVSGSFQDIAQGFLDRHCIECHDNDSKKGDLSLLDLGPVDETNAAVWKSVWAQVALEEMPPKKQDQPEVVERLRFSDWIIGELQRAMKDKGGFHAHQDPKRGNFVASPVVRPAAGGHQTHADLLARPHLASHAAGAHHAAE